MEGIHMTIYPRFVGKVSLYRVRLNSQGYNSDGRYFGIGDPVYRADDEDCTFEHVRAKSRAEAAQKLGISQEQLRRPTTNERPVP